MKRRFQGWDAALLAPLVALVALASGAESAASPPEVACPTRTKEEWQSFRNDLADQYPSISYANASETLEKCSAIFQLNGLSLCMKNLRKFALIKSRQGTEPYGMGFTKKNSEYLKDQPAAVMAIPAPFDKGLPPDWKDVAKAKGWPYLEYSSGLVPNPPNGNKSRLLFYIAGKDFDRWVQFTYPDSFGADRKERLIDMIGIQKKNGGADLKPPRIYFRQYWRDKDGRNPKLRNLDAATSEGRRDSGDDLHSGDNCYTCHPNGIRSLVPAPGTLRAIDKVSSDASNPALNLASLDDLPNERLKQFNEIMNSYTPGGGKIDWNGTIVPEDHGPPKGKALGCVRCHNSNGDSGPGAKDNRGPLNDTTYGLDYKLTDDITMPPTKVDTEVDALNKWHLKGPKAYSDATVLTSEEKALLGELQARGSKYNTLIDSSYRKDLKAWLRDPADCVGSDGGPGTFDGSGTSHPPEIPVPAPNPSENAPGGQQPGGAH